MVVQLVQQMATIKLVRYDARGSLEILGNLIDFNAERFHEDDVLLGCLYASSKNAKEVTRWVLNHILLSTEPLSTDTY